MLFHNHRESYIQWGGEAGHEGCESPRTQPQLRGTANCNGKAAAALKELLLIPSFNRKKQGEGEERQKKTPQATKGKKDRSKTQKLLCQKKRKY